MGCYIQEKMEIMLQTKFNLDSMAAYMITVWTAVYSHQVELELCLEHHLHLVMVVTACAATQHI